MVPLVVLSSPEFFFLLLLLFFSWLVPLVVILTWDGYSSTVVTTFFFLRTWVSEPRRASGPVDVKPKLRQGRSEAKRKAKNQRSLLVPKCKVKNQRKERLDLCFFLKKTRPSIYPS